GLVLTRWEPVFGMPTRVLYVLAAIACVFAFYSFLCFLRKPKNWRPYLKMIAVANLMYACLTLGLVIFLYSQLSIFGLAYFGLELVVVVLLAITELTIAGGNGSRN
ncbi:MAG: hypothetical protein NWS63_00825, partial [Saprospiraceae bacterium]|nr:hypothetical protein [Saprospiraceae bacterium]